MLEQKNIHPLAALMGAAALMIAAPAFAQETAAPATPAANIPGAASSIFSVM